MKKTMLFARFFRFTLVLSALVLAAFAAGCAPGTLVFSPDDAAIRASADAMGQDSVIDTSTIQVRQKVEHAEKTFVLVTFERFFENRNEDCLMVYETSQTRLGTWVAGGGGGGCMGRIGGGVSEEPPLETGGGQQGGDRPGDPGVSHAAGMVFQEDIAKVRVKWNDGSTDEVDVINETYLAVHSGSLVFTAIEGLNEQGEVVFSYESGLPAPAKQ